MRPDNRSYTPIHILDDNTLLHVFYLYQLVFVESYSDVFSLVDWDTARWWYKPAQVCQRWRYLILASPVRLGLHLICTYGTPVVEMLAHSPPLPLIIYYLDGTRHTSREDRVAILLALQHRDRVRRIGLRMPAWKLPKFIKAMDGQFPVLERLFIWPWTEDNTNIVLPTTFLAPHLGQLSLYGVTLPVGSPLLTTTHDLSSLELWDMPLPAYFHPSYLVAQLPFMPRLENLSLGFKSPIPTRNIERLPLNTPIGTHITLPNLRHLFIHGVSAYSEGLLTHINTPLLESVQIQLFNQLNFTVPQLLQFMTRTERFTFSFARLFFEREKVILTMGSLKKGRFIPFKVTVGCRHADWQVSAAVQIFNALAPVLSMVEDLAFNHEEHDPSSEQHNGINRTQWQNLLRPFNSVKALRIPSNLIGPISHSFQPEDGEPLMEPLPELKELVYEKEGGPSDAFTAFINARQIAGHPVALIHVPPPPAPL